MSQSCVHSHHRVPSGAKVDGEHTVTYYSDHTDPIVVRVGIMSPGAVEGSSEATFPSPSGSERLRKRKKDKKKRKKRRRRHSSSSSPTGKLARELTVSR